MDTSIKHALDVLDTEKVNPATIEIDRMSPLEIVQVINAEDAKVAQAVKQVLPHIARAIEEIAIRLRRSGRLVYVGAGKTSGVRGLKVPQWPPNFYTPHGKVITRITARSHTLGHAYQEVEGNCDTQQKHV